MRVVRGVGIPAPFLFMSYLICQHIFSDTINITSLAGSNIITPIDNSGPHRFLYPLPDLTNHHYHALWLDFDVTLSGAVVGSDGHKATPTDATKVFPNTSFAFMDIYLLANTNFASNEEYIAPDGDNTSSGNNPPYIHYSNRIHRIYDFTKKAVLNLQKGIFKNNNTYGDRNYSLLFYNCSNNNITFNSNIVAKFCLRTVNNG